MLAALAVAGCGGGDGGSGAELGVPIPWARAEAAASGDALRVGYETDPCTKARGARVEEDADTVKVTLGDSKRDPKKACIAILERHCALVPLDKPLGTRKVVDGAPPVGGRSRRRLRIESYGACRPVPRL